MPVTVLTEDEQMMKETGDWWYILYQFWMYVFYFNYIVYPLTGD